MVPYRGVTDLSRLPLLPFERELVATLGCTEAEYRAFTVEAMKRSRVRPAEYDHIPDIAAGPAVFVTAAVAASTGATAGLTVLGTVLLNIAVGLALSAVSFLLMPKPKQQGQTTSRQLASRTGADRFSATNGFDTQAELANYGDPIPIIFGQSTAATGGILAAPSLVWSRAFSYGSQQGVKLMFVVGEQGTGANGLPIPSVNGIFLGNTALDAIYRHNFAFYWKRDTNTNARIFTENLRYGTSGTDSSGDPESSGDVFSCPTINSVEDTGFCHAYTPTANTQFGVHSGIHNGSDYRVNWKLVAIPNIPGSSDRYKDDPKVQRLKERIKIAGDYGIAEDKVLDIRAEGQKGTGRGYGRLMGLTKFNGQEATTGETQFFTASIGSKAQFTIVGSELLDLNTYYVNDKDGTIYEGTKVDDINSEITTGRRNADDMLQYGETIMIGRTVWKVIERTEAAWEVTKEQAITLECVETFGADQGSRIGVISRKMLYSRIRSDDNGATNAGGGLGLHAGNGFYPLLRVAFGVVRNTRDCEVTEIGLRSQVWNRANGLCNFQGLPSVEAFKSAEEDGVAIESGVMSVYFKRTSVFTILLRPSGTDASGNEYPWAALGEQFCVTGEAPQDQFNFIRIQHPARGRYEFKMLPKSGADIARHSPASAQFFLLDAKRRGKIESKITGTYSTNYGTFNITTLGKKVTKEEIVFNPELAVEATTETFAPITGAPSPLNVVTFLPDEQGSTTAAVAVAFNEDWLPTNVTKGRQATAEYSLFGPARAIGTTGTATRTATVPGNPAGVKLKFTSVVNATYPSTHPYFANENRWGPIIITVVAPTPYSRENQGVNTGQVLNVNIGGISGNPAAQAYGLTSVGMLVTVTQTTGVTPTGRQAGYGYELFGDASSYPAGVRQEVTETFTTGTGLLQKQMQVFVSALPGADRNKWGDFQYRFQSSSTTWKVGDTISNLKNVSANNPFTAESRVGVMLTVGGIGAIAQPPRITAARNFEEHSQVNDVSFYSSMVNKSNEKGPEHEIVYVNEIVSNDETPKYTNLTTAGLALKASRNFTSLDQLRVWLPDGISVTKFGAASPGPSNKFTDLVYYLLTDKVAGAGSVISDKLIDTAKFPATSQFLEQNKLFFDGAIDQPTNMRQFISDTAPFFLCAFIISNGKFSIIPAVPTTSAGLISDMPVKIQQLFTSGNIIEDSFSVEYLSTEERKDFQAVMRYRTATRNQFPEEKTLVVRFPGSEAATIETFDMTQYCTSRDHAFLVAKYFLSLRRRVTHTVRFRTTPYGISLAPGDYIRVITEASPYSAANNGVVDGNLNITSVTPLADGVYTVSYWNADFDDIKTENMTVASGKAVETKYANSIFTLVDASVSSGTYMVEQLTLSEEGLVDIVAVEFPTTSAFNSLIALDLLNSSAFTTEG
jgi:hypothetical protein